MELSCCLCYLFCCYCRKAQGIHHCTEQTDQVNKNTIEGRVGYGSEPTSLHVCGGKLVANK